MRLVVRSAERHRVHKDLHKAAKQHVCGKQGSGSGVTGSVSAVGVGVIAVRFCS